MKSIFARTRISYLFFYPHFFVLWVWISAFSAHANLPKAKALSLGRGYGCVTSTDNQLFCWGTNDKDQTSFPKDILLATSVSTGPTESCLVDLGNVRCWGSDQWGVKNVPPSLKAVKEVVVGGRKDDGWSGGVPSFACAIDATGTHCWGNGYPVPLEVPAQENPRKLIAGQGYACVRVDSGVRCASYYGGGGWIIVDMPPANQLTDVVDLAGGDEHVCVLTQSRGILCWGDREDARLAVPAEALGAQRLFAGMQSTCALKENGSITCWGNDQSVNQVPSQISNVKEVQIGGREVCALLKTGAVTCWGITSHIHGDQFVSQGMLGVTDINIGNGFMIGTRNSESPGLSFWGSAGMYFNVLPDLYSQKPFRKVAITKEFICGSEPGGLVECWRDHNYPMYPATDHYLDGLTELVSGKMSVCAYSQNRIKCYGMTDGGFNPYIGKNSGFEEFPGSQLKAVVIGNQTLCALGDENLNCYHYGSDHVPLKLPEVLMGLKTESIASNHNDVFCSKSKDRLTCWFYDFSNQPKIVFNIEVAGIQDVALGSSHVCFTLTLPSLKNEVECLEISRQELLTPQPWKFKKPLNIQNARSLRAGGSNSCVLDIDQWKCWGDNSNSQNNLPYVDLK